MIELKIDDATLEAGVQAACDAANAAMPQTVTVDGVESPNPALYADATAYLQFVMESAAQSYANQYLSVTVEQGGKKDYYPPEEAAAITAAIATVAKPIGIKPSPPIKVGP